MRFLHGADFHLGRTTHSSPGTTSRADDFAATLLRFADTAVEGRVDAALIAGDCFHTRRPTPKDLFALTTAVRRLRDGNVLTLLAPGNHDGMDAVGDERTHALAWMKELQPEGVRVLTSPTRGRITTLTNETFALVSTPYPHKRSFDAVMPDSEPEERVEAISTKFEEAILTLRDDVNESTYPVVFLGHLSVVGAALGSEVTMRFGWDVTVRSGIFDRFDYAALGHIHRQQQMGDKAWYAGSPEPMDFGEVGQRKGFLLVEVEAGKEAKVEYIDSGARPMLAIEMRQSDGVWVASEEIPKGAIVDVSIYPEGGVSPGEVLAIVRDLRSDGASYVKSRVVLPERNAVRVEVDAQVEAGEALRRWLVTNEYEPEPYLSVGMDLIAEVGA